MKTYEVQFCVFRKSSVGYIYSEEDYESKEIEILNGECIDEQFKEWFRNAMEHDYGSDYDDLDDLNYDIVSIRRIK